MTYINNHWMMYSYEYFRLSMHEYVGKAWKVHFGLLYYTLLLPTHKLHHNTISIIMATCFDTNLSSSGQYVTDQIATTTPLCTQDTHILPPTPLQYSTLTFFHPHCCQYCIVTFFHAHYQYSTHILPPTLLLIQYSHILPLTLISIQYTHTLQFIPLWNVHTPQLLHTTYNKSNPLIHSKDLVRSSMFKKQLIQL
jgi:hypothetical protein